MKTNRKELISVLAKVRPGIGNKEDKFSNFIFTGKNLVTYNEGICIKHPFETDFECSITANEFHVTLQKLKSDKIDLELLDKELIVKSKRSKMRLAITEDEETLNIIKQILPDKKLRFKNLTDDFKEALKSCMFSVDNDETDVLNNLSIDKNQVISSDDVRVTLFEMKEGLKDSFLLPVKSVFELIKFDVNKYCLKEDWIYFKTDDDVLFCSRVISKEYPDMLGFFEFDSTRMRLPDELNDIIDRSIILAEGDKDIDKKITVEIGNGKIKCIGEKDIGRIESEMDLIGKKKAEFVINPIFFNKILTIGCDIAYIGENRLMFKTDNFKHLISLYPTEIEEEE